MGQYYAQYLKEKGTQKEHYFCCQVKGHDSIDEHNGLKLMEHSWFYNPFVLSVCGFLAETPCHVYWVGDYAESCAEDEKERKLYDKIWKYASNEHRDVTIENNQLSLRNHYLVNLTKKQYLDGDNYFNLSNYEEFWKGNGADIKDRFYIECIHPLPLLTCAGNGLGGGDYEGTDMDYIGYWRGDVITVENKHGVPDCIKKKFQKICPIFHEKYEH